MAVLRIGRGAPFLPSFVPNVNAGGTRLAPFMLWPASPANITIRQSGCSARDSILNRHHIANWFPLPTAPSLSKLAGGHLHIHASAHAGEGLVYTVFGALA